LLPYEEVAVQRFLSNFLFY